MPHNDLLVLPILEFLRLRVPLGIVGVSKSSGVEIIHVGEQGNDAGVCGWLRFD